MKFDKFDKAKSISYILRIIEKLGHKSTFAVKEVLKSAYKSSKKDFIYAYKTLANSVFENDSKINDDIAFFYIKINDWSDSRNNWFSNKKEVTKNNS